VTVPPRLSAARLIAGTIAIVLLLVAFGGGGVAAQEYPTHQVRVIVPFLPGAGTDLTGRLAAQELTRRLGQSFYVENKAGAGSQIGIDLVAKSRPDGYTLLWTASDGISVLPAVKQGLPYRVPQDFAFIARLIELPYVVVVNPSVPAKTLSELIAYAKAHPGQLRYGTSGIGTATHMGMALLARAADIEMLHVPYEGVAPSVAAVVAGNIDLALAAPSSVKSFADAGTLRALATTGPVRHQLYPDVPTLQEAGLPGVSIVGWYGLMAAAGTPEPILTRLREAIAAALKDPDVVARMTKLGYAPAYLGGDAFRDFVVKDLDQWKTVAQAASITLN
jgi:tripartite-type tricarboxylate transporter receptor subunit TctC